MSLLKPSRCSATGIKAGPERSPSPCLGWLRRWTACAINKASSCRSMGKRRWRSSGQRPRRLSSNSSSAPSNAAARRELPASLTKTGVRVGLLLDRTLGRRSIQAGTASRLRC
ncbi:hypothetical protein [Lysobacter gummosus]|uniref:hypothetical protein n=1 Tax=Lysobacter gummosus TaxID=262324 RepID=UPI00363A580C